jgi:2-dehydro-3-deoxyphosphogluconate aldolase/(4S)-4-hydroxy-2-oxoglutarate aldolase
MRKLMEGHPLIAVITLEHSEDAVPLAKALVSGGIFALEITLRTDAAVDGIRKIIEAVPEAIVGTGTVCSEQQISLSQDLGCSYMVSPGSTSRLLEAGQRASIPLLPGVSTVSELMEGMQYGYRDFKLFPAQAVGGVSFLKALMGPFPGLKFCPTGGVNPDNIGEYLALDNVLSVGGSWIAPRAMIREKKWSDIEKLATQAKKLCS